MLRRLLLPLLLLVACPGCQQDDKELIVGRWSHKRMSLIIEESGRVWHRSNGERSIGVWRYNDQMDPPVLTLKMIPDSRPDEVIMAYYEVEFLVDDRIRLTRFNPENRVRPKPGEMPDRFLVMKRGEEKKDSKDKEAVASAGENTIR